MNETEKPTYHSLIMLLSPGLELERNEILPCSYLIISYFAKFWSAARKIKAKLRGRENEKKKKKTEQIQIQIY